MVLQQKSTHRTTVATDAGLVWQKFPINLTKEQVKSSLDIETDQPVSNQQEIDMYGHCAWLNNACASFYAGGSTTLINLSTEVDEEIIKENAPLNCQDSYDPHLRRTEKVSGYYVQATDGDTGHIKQFVIDGDSWKITDLEIDTYNCVGGHKVLMPVQHVKEIQWENYKIMLDVSIEFIKDKSVFKEAN